MHEMNEYEQGEFKVKIRTFNYCIEQEEEGEEKNTKKTKT